MQLIASYPTPSLDSIAPNNKFILPEIIDCDRRPTLVKYAASLRAYGKEFPEIYQALLQANTQRCVPPLSSQHDLNDIKRIAEWASKKAVSTKKPQISEADALRLTAAEYAIKTYPWRGSKAHNDKRVALAVLTKMRADCTTSACVADVRTLAEIAGPSRSTVSRALKKLTGEKKDSAIPLIFTRQKPQTIKTFEDGRDPLQYAYMYTLRDSFIGYKNETHFLSLLTTSSCLKTAPSDSLENAPSASLSLSLPPSEEKKKKEGLLPSSSALVPSPPDKGNGLLTQTEFLTESAFFAPSSAHDAFRVRGKGLTKSAATVYDTLPAKTQKEIHERTGLALRTVKIAFAALQDEHLIEKQNNLWVRTEESLDDVAVRRGTRGAGEKQKQEHAYERKVYREKLGETGGNLKMVAKKEAKIPIVVEVNNLVNWDELNENDYQGVKDALVDVDYEEMAVHASSVVGIPASSEVQLIANNAPKISHDPLLSQPSLTKNPPCPLSSQQIINPPSLSPMILTTKMKMKMIEKIYDLLAQQSA